MNANEIWRILDGFTHAQVRNFITDQLNVNVDDTANDVVMKAVRQWASTREEEDARLELQQRAITFRSQSIRAEAYPRTDAKGCALIIGNSFKTEEFKNEYWRETICQKDLEIMADLWENFFGCDLLDGQVHKDQTAAQMRDLMKKMASPEKKYDFIVVVISTHGGTITGEKESDILLGNDGHKLRLNDLRTFFRNDKAIRLQDVPKLFILEYCRGKNIDSGLLRGTDDFPRTRILPQDKLLPAFSDTLMMFATQESYVAWASRDEGSWLLTAVNEVFRHNAKETDVVGMLTRVNDEMKNKRGENKGKDCKAMSVFESTLTKELYLYPQVEEGRVESPSQGPSENLEVETETQVNPVRKATNDS